MKGKVRNEAPTAEYIRSFLNIKMQKPDNFGALSGLKFLVFREEKGDSLWIL